MDWRPVLQGHYEVSPLGDVRRAVPGRGTEVGHILKQQDNDHGYKTVALSIGGYARRFVVHRLVAEAFIGPGPLGMVVNHIDGDKLNNHATNLEYTTPQQNSQRAGINGQLRQGANHPASKVTEDQVRAIRAAVRDGASQQSQCKKYGLTPCTVSFMVRGITWKSVK